MLIEMKKILVSLFILSAFSGLYCARLQKPELFIQVLRGLEELRRTGTPPASLTKAVKQYNKPNIFTSTESFDKDETCITCSIIVDLMIQQRRSGMNDTDFKKELLFFCNLYEAYAPRVCDGMVEINTPTFLYILDNTPDLKGVDVCAISLQFNDCALSQRFKWNIEIPPGSTVTKEQSTEESTFNILHISDIHYDPRYTKGKTNVCGEPVCCQDDQPDGKTEEESCGYWSDYTNADIPWRTVVDALEQTKHHEYDFVYFTGDIVSHRIWSTSVEDNSKIISQILDAFSQYYKVPVFPCLGNHEAHPANLYSETVDPAFSTKWLFDILFQKLSKWLPVDEIKETVLKGGYYTVSPKKGFRVIVLNNNVCNSNNWWLVYNPHDPYDQLKWLAGVLLKAEQNKEKVHILYHMPTGRDECYFVWAREYRKIVDRFANTIAAQFNGHTHRDEFNIFYNRSNPEQAINMVWNGASVTTYDKANPSYKLINIDGKTLDVIDFEEWTYNLTLANLTPSKNPKWFKLYSFKEAFGVKNLQANEIHKLVMKMTQKHEILDQYQRYKFREGDLEMANGCDDACKKDLLCTMVKTEYGDNMMCDKVKKLYDNVSEVKITVL